MGVKHIRKHTHTSTCTRSARWKTELNENLFKQMSSLAWNRATSSSRMCARCVGRISQIIKCNQHYGLQVRIKNFMSVYCSFEFFPRLMSLFLCVCRISNANKCKSETMTTENYAEQVFLLALCACISCSLGLALFPGAFAAHIETIPHTRIQSTLIHSTFNGKHYQVFVLNFSECLLLSSSSSSSVSLLPYMIRFNQIK